MIPEVDVAIIGAGVVGLAVAAELAQQNRGVFVFEKNHTFGLETSSRNSEVIHTGIYYPERSLKAKLCVEGKALLYELCDKYGIGHKKLGKLIVATSENEIAQLERLREQGKRNGIEDLTLLSGAEIKKLEPNVEGRAGLLSPSTGIIDSQALLRCFCGLAREKGAHLVFNAEVVGIKWMRGRYKVKMREGGRLSEFVARVVINAAGLNSDSVAKLVGVDIAKAGYQLHYCKGEYFSLNSRWRNMVSRLIYPTPEESGLGVHLTVALDGRLRLGPNVRYVEAIDYRVDESQRIAFYQSAKRFLPFIELEDLEPEFAGIRPKLQSPGEAFRDFVIAHEEKAGFLGLINLIGIESPGITASPAIARYVVKMVAEILS